MSGFASRIEVGFQFSAPNQSGPPNPQSSMITSASLVNQLFIVICCYLLRYICACGPHRSYKLDHVEPLNGE